MKKTGLLLLALILSVGVFAQNAAEKINKANEALKAKKYADAFKLYDEAMGNLGDVKVDKSINFNIGYAAYKSDNHEGAIKYFDKAIENEVSVSKCYSYKAMVYTDMKKYKEAVDAYEKAAETAKEKDASLIYNGAIVAYKGKMYEKAVELFGKSVDEGYKAKTALYYKALMYSKLKQDDKYLETIKEGYEKYPKNKKFSSALVKNYVSEGNKLYQAGAAIVTAANKKVSSGAISTADAAYTKELSKAKAEFAKAKTILEKAIKIDAKNVNAKKLLDACNAIK